MALRNIKQIILDKRMGFYKSLHLLSTLSFVFLGSLFLQCQTALGQTGESRQQKVAREIIAYGLGGDGNPLAVGFVVKGVDSKYYVISTYHGFYISDKSTGTGRLAIQGVKIPSIGIEGLLITNDNLKIVGQPSKSSDLLVLEISSSNEDLKKLEKVTFDKIFRTNPVNTNNESILIRGSEGDVFLGNINSLASSNFEGCDRKENPLLTYKKTGEYSLKTGDSGAAIIGSGSEIVGMHNCGIANSTSGRGMPTTVLLNTYSDQFASKKTANSAKLPSNGNIGKPPFGKPLPKLPSQSCRLNDVANSCSSTSGCTTVDGCTTINGCTTTSKSCKPTDRVFQ
jgi:hypothetical protein